MLMSLGRLELGVGLIFVLLTLGQQPSNCVHYLYSKTFNPLPMAFLQRRVFLRVGQPQRGRLCLLPSFP